MKRFWIIKKNLLLNSIAIFAKSVDGPTLLATCKRSLNQFEHVYLAHQKRTNEISFRRQPVQKIAHIIREFVEFFHVFRPFYFPWHVVEYIHSNGRRTPDGRVQIKSPPQKKKIIYTYKNMF